MSIHSTLSQIRSTLLLSVLILAPASSAEMSMCVHPLIGSPIYISLKDQPDIEFSNGSISIKGQSFEIKEISKYTFTSSDGIENIAADSRIRIEDRMVYIPSGLHISRVSVVDISGIEQPANVIKERGRTSIDLSGLESGLYILSLDDSSLKILLK